MASNDSQAARAFFSSLRSWKRTIPLLNREISWVGSIVHGPVKGIHRFIRAAASAVHDTQIRPDIGVIRI
jgi:hypothetical protein